MPSPSAIRAAQAAPDRMERVAKMAEVMRDRATGTEGACQLAHLHQAGFSAAEIEAYREEARLKADGREAPILIPDGRLEGVMLASRALAMKAERAAQGREAN